MTDLQTLTLIALTMYAGSGLFISALNRVSRELCISDRLLNAERAKEPLYITQWKTPPQPDIVFSFNGQNALEGDRFMWTGKELQRVLPPPIDLSDFDLVEMPDSINSADGFVDWAKCR